MNPVEWTPEERRLAVATALAPLAASAVVAALSLLIAKPIDAVLLFVALVPAAYATLFAAVLPSLWLLRRTGKEALWSFSAVCGLSTAAPWLGLYALFFGNPGNGKFGGAMAEVATGLCIPGLISAITAAIIYRQFGQRSLR